MKAIKMFKAVPAGEIYPVTVEAGEEIPKGLEDTAKELGAAPKQSTKAAKRAPENK